MIINLIVAASENNVIGKENSIPWRLSADLKQFKKLTLNKPIIMGYNTFKSIPNSPLINRINVILTRREIKIDECLVFNNIDLCLRSLIELNFDEVFVIGGGEIYKQFIDIADNIYLTRIHKNIDGDKYFPIIDHDKWSKIEELFIDTDITVNFNYSFFKYKLNDNKFKHTQNIY